MKTKAIYSPQPDEPQESAASYEYAKRISDLLGGVPGDGPTSISSSSAETDGDGEANAIVVERLSLESLNFLTSPEENCTQCIFIISCSSDGSVDRIVRKIVRNLRNSTDNTATSENKPKVAIALLGHARCENSANQMKDTIFGNGRKFLKAVVGLLNVAASDNSKDGLSSVESLEVQVELEGPDSPGGFDEWIKRIVQ